MLGEVETMSFKLEANPIGLRGAFPHLSIKGFQRLGESGNSCN